MHVCDDSLSEMKVLAKQQVIERVHIQGRGPLITISLCRKCCTAYFGREDISISEFGFSRCDTRTQINMMSITMFAHKLVETYLNTKKKERGLLEPKDGNGFGQRVRQHLTEHIRSWSSKTDRSAHNQVLLRVKALRSVSGCTWYVCSGVSNSVTHDGGNWFCVKCEHVYSWKEGSRILPPGLNGVALYGAYPTLKGGRPIDQTLGK